MSNTETGREIETTGREVIRLARAAFKWHKMDMVAVRYYRDGACSGTEIYQSIDGMESFCRYAEEAPEAPLSLKAIHVANLAEVSLPEGVSARFAAIELD